jgi:hypothetical protein
MLLVLKEDLVALEEVKEEAAEREDRDVDKIDWS